MPLVYDEEPGSWGRLSNGWPSFTLTAAMIEAKDRAGDAGHYPATAIVTPLMNKAKVPYGSYVVMGNGFAYKHPDAPVWARHERTYHDVEVRVETHEYKKACLAALENRIV